MPSCKRFIYLFLSTLGFAGLFGMVWVGLMVGGGQGWVRSVLLSSCISCGTDGASSPVKVYRSIGGVFVIVGGRGLVCVGGRVSLLGI